MFSVTSYADLRRRSVWTLLPHLYPLDAGVLFSEYAIPVLSLLRLYVVRRRDRTEARTQAALRALRVLLAVSLLQTPAARMYDGFSVPSVGPLLIDKIAITATERDFT
jgi:hypothetical protein